VIPRSMLTLTEGTQQCAEDDLAILAADIKAEGLREPLLVREKHAHESPGCYVVVVGERRLQASELAGLVEIPCMIGDIEPEDHEAARVEYQEKRLRWVAFFPVLKRAMVEKAVKLRRIPPPLFKRVLADHDLPKKIEPRDLAAALTLKSVIKEVNRPADSYFAEERLAPWAKALGINLKALEREAKR
jgi:hypothetical protein